MISIKNGTGKFYDPYRQTESPQRVDERISIRTHKSLLLSCLYLFFVRLHKKSEIVALIFYERYEQHRILCKILIECLSCDSFT